MDKKQLNLRKLKQLCIELCRKPTHREINKCSYTPTKGYYIHHYKNIENAFNLIKCEKMPIKGYNKKENIVKAFYELKNKLGFTPSSFDWIKYSPLDICGIYRIFGSWNNFIKGLNEKVYRKIPNDFKNKKRIFISNDGHKCYSKKERDIDNLLIEIGLSHENEVFYPFDSVLNKHSRKRCDWKVGNTYVEYAGMLAYYDPIARSKYRKRIEDKVNLCLLHELDFLIIEPDKLNNIKSDLIEWFKK